MVIWYIHYAPWDWHQRNLYLCDEMISVWKEAGHKAKIVNVDLFSLAQTIREKDAKCRVAFIHDWQTVEAAARVGLDIVGRSKFRVLIVGGGWRRPHWVEKSLKAVKDMQVHLVCLTQRVHYNKFKQAHKRVFHVGLGFSPEVFYPDWDRERRNVIYFCGDRGSGRQARLDLLNRKFPGQTHFEASHRVPHADMAEGLRNATIGWNQIDKGPEEHGVAENLRIGETIGSGTCLLCSKSKHNPLKDGIHYVSWANDHELIEKARWLLDHPKECEEIARQGWEESANHTWRHRALEYKELVEKHL